MNAMLAAASRPFRNATRIQTSVLAPLEKRTLLWLAARIPPGINSDHLTALALAAMMAAGAAYTLARFTPIGLLLANVCLAVNWFGDSLDGTLARVRHQQRPRYGFYVDHVADLVGVAFLVGGMSVSGHMQPMVGMALLSAYVMLSAEVYLATHSLGRFRMSFFKMGPTELRLLLATGNLILFFKPTVQVLGQEFRLFDLGGAVATAGLALTFLLSAAANTRDLYRAEPLPTRRVPK